MTSPGKGRPEEGTPEYDWLYGNSSSGTQSGDEATRMMKVSPRGSQADRTRAMTSAAGPGTDGPIRYTEESGGRQSARKQGTRPPVAPTGSGSGGSGTGGSGTGGPGSGSGRSLPPVPRPRLKVRRLLRLVPLLLLLWVAYLVVVPFMAWNKVSTVDAMPSGERPSSQSGTTYLLVGSDSRKGLTKKERRQLNTGGDVGQRTDTIMLLHTGSGPNLLTSIPRDSLVQVPGHGRSKINSAFAHGGPKLLTETVEQNTGIRIDHYVEIGMGGVVDVVDAVGGVEICPTTRMKDPLAGLDIKKGCQEADGRTALAYARSRHAQQYGDMGRAAAQREVVAQVGQKAVSPMSVVNPVRYWNLWTTAADMLKVSEGTGVFSAGKFAMAMTSTDMTCGVPINSWQVTWDPERSEEFFSHIINDTVDEMPKKLCTVSGLPNK